MRGAQDQIKGLVPPAALLVDAKSGGGRRDGCRSQLALPAPAPGNDESHLTALDGLRRRQLGVIQGVPGLGLDILVDLQHLLGQRLLGQVE